MKNFSKLLVVAIVAMAAALPAAAQFRYGVKAGVAINEMKFSEKAFDSSNRAGFTGGVMAEFTLPVLGIGCDASLLYATRSVDLTLDENGNTTEISKTRSYIDIPINFKWKINIPAVSSFFSPFVTTGPDFSFLLSKKNIQNAIENKSFDFAWNIGIGFDIIKHVQLAANYGIAIGRQASYDVNGSGLYHGKNRCWTITAAYLF